MASPVYFFPGVRESAVVQANRLRASFLRERGVAAAFAGITDVRAQTSCYELPGRGPGGQAGLVLQVVAPRPGVEPPVNIGYAGEVSQAWHERPAGCDCWVGIDKTWPPTPAELAIGTPTGYPLELGDGQTWKVPIVRSVQPERSQVPFDYVFDGSGRLVIEQQASPLWDLAEEGWNHYFHRAQHPTISTEILVALCLGALALNYRLGNVEQTVLRLVNSRNWSRCMELLLDAPLLEEHAALEKKTGDRSAPGLPSASPGPAD